MIEASTYGVPVLVNPDQDALRALALTHTPGVLRSAVGNLNKISRNKSRMARFTWIIAPSDQAAQHSGQLIEPARAQALIAAQTRYIQQQGQLLAVRGDLGVGPRAVGVEWLYTPEAANIAGMQAVLAFLPPGEGGVPAGWRAQLRVVYTPGCPAEGMPGGQAILVDLERSTTYILGPDYFGESKKAALRMLCALVWQQGGLVLHAGAKLVETGGRRFTMTIKGLSGTGKTTTTFSKQGERTRPVQDDMVVLWPGGELSVTENGCFAKTFGLSEATEPVIWRGTLSPSAWVENVYVDERGHYDFFKGLLSPEEVDRLAELLIATGADAERVRAYASGQVPLSQAVDADGAPLDGWDFVRWTENGRSIIPMSAIEDAADLHAVPPVGSLGILNRDEGPDAITPALTRFTSPEQGAGYFMLGETTKTSAAGKERGRTRSPFTQPFFPLAHHLQAQRFSELAATTPGVELWRMNTGYVAGDARSVRHGEGFKVSIAMSSALLEALVEDRIAWERDPDFGYEVVAVDDARNAGLLQQVPAEVLQPRRLFAAQGRLDEYLGAVQRLHAERRAFLERYAVAPDILAAVCPG